MQTTGLCFRATITASASEYITPLDGIRRVVGDSVRIYYSEGCHKFKDRTEGLAFPDDRISEAVTAAKESDVAVVVLGLDETRKARNSTRAMPTGRRPGKYRPSRASASASAGGAGHRYPHCGRALQQAAR